MIKALKAVECSFLKGSIPYFATSRWLSLSCNLLKFGSEWRYSQGKASDKLKYGKITDGPDFTYLDGRPTPLSKGQVRRREERIQTTKKIMTLLTEVDFAKDLHQKRMADPKPVVERIQYKSKGD